jgi:subtilisin family serine protease
MFHPSWDLPPGDPGNYSDNPNHPFNRSVGALAALGADILFAAGNCGPQCPDSRCQDVSANAIYGANGHPDVLSVAGVDTAGERVGYSTIGPGRLTDRKPDISGYTHFKGSGVFPEDSGTSAATPVVAGVLAAVRSKRAFDPADPATSPAAIRELLASTAKDLGDAGYDYEHGYGVVDGARLRDELCDEPPPQPPSD